MARTGRPKKAAKKAHAVIRISKEHKIQLDLCLMEQNLTIDDFFETVFEVLKKPFTYMAVPENMSEDLSLVKGKEILDCVNEKRKPKQIGVCIYLGEVK